MTEARAAWDELRQELRGEVPPGFAELDPADLAHLTSAVREAARREREALVAATDRGLGFVPAVLRGAVTKVLLG